MLYCTKRASVILGLMSLSLSQEETLGNNASTHDVIGQEGQVSIFRFVSHDLMTITVKKTDTLLAASKVD